MAPQQAATTSSRLLDLPPELRNSIYRLALRNIRPIKPLTGRPPALVQANKQIRAEATSIYYAENTFSIALTACTATAITKWTHSLGQRNATLIPSINVYCGNDPKSKKRLHILRAMFFNPHVSRSEKNLFGIVCRVKARDYAAIGVDVARQVMQAGVDAKRIVMGKGLPTIMDRCQRMLWESFEEEVGRCRNEQWAASDRQEDQVAK